ncbi:MAG TPA: glycosyltransferase family 2 protein [Candidatus Paceibacterota bacterium]|jgi:Glycosyltransferases involved in cell wall biogenesis
MVSIVIPAFNEEATVADVVRAALSYGGAKQVIVVDDGSTDKTADAARASGAMVIRLEQNSGKARAMDAGVRAATSDVIVFLDADVTGLDAERISRIAGPVIRGEKEMYVGIRARKTIMLNSVLHLFPILGGERAITRALWEAVPKRRKKGFEIEIALNHAAKSTTKGMGFELVPGIKNTIKEKKYGLVLGFLRRLRMIWQIACVSFDIYALEQLKAGTLRLKKVFVAAE